MSRHPRENSFIDERMNELTRGRRSVEILFIPRRRQLEGEEEVISSRRKLNKRQTRESTLVGQIRGVFSLLSICFQATGHVFPRGILTEIDRASFFLRFFHVLSFRQESLNRSRYHPPFPFSFLDQHPASISDLTHGHASVSNFPLGSRILPRRKIPLSRLFAALFRFSKFSDHAIEEAVEKYSPG